MTRIARFLPVLTVLAWVITLALPILDSGNTRGPKIVVSSLGGAPFDLSDANPIFIVAGAAVVGCAASVWLFRSLTWWSITAILVVVLLGTMLLGMILEPPSVIWDGVDPQCRPTGGYEVGEPAAGAWVWAMGIVALFTAGICGLIGRARHQPRQ